MNNDIDPTEQVIVDSWGESKHRLTQTPFQKGSLVGPVRWKATKLVHLHLSLFAACGPIHTVDLRHVVLRKKDVKQMSTKGPCATCKQDD